MNKPSQGFATIAASVIFCALATTPVEAQDAAPPPDVTVVHPEDDGFPDLQAAYNVLDNSPLGKRFDNSLSNNHEFDDSTLTGKRAILRDPAAQSALALLHSALAAPHIAPARILNMHLSPMMQLLNIELYVQFADGKTLAAIDTFDEGCRLADVVATSFAMGGAFTQIIKLTLIQATAAHLDQLSARDSAYLLSVIRRELAQPDSFLAACEAERRIRQAAVGDRIAAALTSEDADADDMPFHLTPTIRKDAGDILGGNPALVTTLTQSIKKQIDAYFDDLEARHQAFPVAMPDTRTFRNGKTVTGYAAADQVAALLVALNTQGPGTEQNVIENEMRVRATQRLLAVHAAIVAYRWEHNRVPDSLAELNLGVLAQDPFSAQPFQYAKTGDQTYTLSSLGSPKRVADGNGDRVADGKPVPIDLLTR